MKTDQLDRISKASDQMWTMMFDPKTAFGAAFYGLLTILLAWLIGRAVKLAINRALDTAQKGGADPTGLRFLGKLVSVIIYFGAFACYAHVIPELQTLGRSMLAGVGVASVVVGLAAQSTLGNLIAGISLVLYRPFKIGDRVQVYVAAGSDVARARQALLDLARAHPKIAQVDGCYVTRVTSRGVILALAAACADPDAVPGVKSDLLENARKQFDAAGIKLV